MDDTSITSCGFRRPRSFWRVTDVTGMNSLSAISICPCFHPRIRNCFPQLLDLLLSFLELLLFHPPRRWPILISILEGNKRLRESDSRDEDTRETKSNTGAYDEAGEQGKRHLVYMLLTISLEVQRVLWQMRIWKSK